MLLLFTLKRHTSGDTVRRQAVAAPAAPVASARPSAPSSTIVEPRALSAPFYAFATSCALGTMGLMTFGVISFHLVDASLVTTAVVPLIYAAAMGTEAVAALVTGFAYDRWGAAVLYTLPVTVVAVPALALPTPSTVVVAGVLLWGAVTGVQDSTVKALVADLVPQRRLATAYGVFAAFQGVAALCRRNPRRRPLHRAPHPAHRTGRDCPGCFRVPVVFCAATPSQVTTDCAVTPGLGTFSSPFPGA